jgi:hypothetical protein
MPAKLGARRCALCGKGQTYRLGGLLAFAAGLREYAKTHPLKLQSSSYAHVPCMHATRLPSQQAAARRVSLYNDVLAMIERAASYGNAVSAEELNEKFPGRSRRDRRRARAARAPEAHLERRHAPTLAAVRTPTRGRLR